MFIFRSEIGKIFIHLEKKRLEFTSFEKRKKKRNLLAQV